MSSCSFVCHRCGYVQSGYFNFRPCHAPTVTPVYGGDDAKIASLTPTLVGTDVSTPADIAVTEAAATRAAFATAAVPDVAVVFSRVRPRGLAGQDPECYVVREVIFPGLQ